MTVKNYISASAQISEEGDLTEFRYKDSALGKNLSFTKNASGNYLCLESEKNSVGVTVNRYPSIIKKEEAYEKISELFNSENSKGKKRFVIKKENDKKQREFTGDDIDLALSELFEGRKNFELMQKIRELCQGVEEERINRENLGWENIKDIFKVASTQLIICFNENGSLAEIRRSSFGHSGDLIEECNITNNHDGAFFHELENNNITKARARELINIYVKSSDLSKIFILCDHNNQSLVHSYHGEGLEAGKENVLTLINTKPEKRSELFLAMEEVEKHVDSGGFEFVEGPKTEMNQIKTSELVKKGFSKHLDENGFGINFN